MAAVDMFLKLDGIKGESKDPTHPGEIEILSYSWGMSQTSVGTLGSGGGSGKVSVHDISVTKVTDSASPQLMVSCATGKHLASGIIAVRKAGEKPIEYLKIKLTDILISSIQMDGHGSALPAESFTLDFKKAQFAISSPNGGIIASLATIVNEEQGQVVAPPPPA
jgi:type VI secretion system secreted protein Hcp